MLTDDVILEKLKTLSGWSFDPEKKQLRKQFDFKGYYKTISFVNTLAWLANKYNHHPDLWVTFSSCTVHLTTHDQGGVTEKDVELAEAIEKLLQ